MSKYYLGIMCGTSLDSIDISMIRCHGDKIKVMAFAEYRLKNKIKEQINILKTNTNQEIINKDKKIHFFKTHNAICTINGNKFTDNSNTLAAIYVVRDPRNLISSISNHYEFSLEESFNFMTNKRKIIFPKDPSTKEKIKAEAIGLRFLKEESNAKLPI